MNGQTIAILAGIAAVVVIVIVLVMKLRNKDSISGSLSVRGVGKGAFKAGNSPRDANIINGEATEDATATAPQGSATISGTKGRNLTATAGEPQNPK